MKYGVIDLFHVHVTWTVADPELFLRGGPLTDLRGAHFSHASMIPYIINQIFPKKGGAGAPQAPPGSAYDGVEKYQELHYYNIGLITVRVVLHCTNKWLYSGIALQ